MGIQITKVDDKADGFTVEFTSITTYKRTFAPRPPGKDQMLYARENVQSIVSSPVEKPEGVLVTNQPVSAEIDENKVIELDENNQPIT